MISIGLGFTFTKHNTLVQYLKFCCHGDNKGSLLPAQFNHLSVVRLKVILPAHSDPISGHS